MVWMIWLGISLVVGVAQTSLNGFLGEKILFAENNVTEGFTALGS